MKKPIFSFFVGLTFATIAFIPILIHERKKQYDVGRNTGKIDSLLEAADALDKEFGRYDGKTEYRLLFSVKTTEVISVNINGVRTVRIIP